MIKLHDRVIGTLDGLRLTNNLLVINLSVIMCANVFVRNHRPLSCDQMLLKSYEGVSLFVLEQC